MCGLTWLLRSFAIAAFGVATGCASWERPAISPVQSNEVVWSSRQPVNDQLAIVPVAAISEVEADPKKNSLPTAFQLPPGLPGADAKPIVIPSLKDVSPAEREKRIRDVYPALPALPDDPQSSLADGGKPLTLRDLQEMALQNNPTIKRATADMDAAYGTMVQSGLYPNPTIGYQGDQIQPGNKPSNNAGQQGAFIQQLFKTAGKLSLSRAAAGMSYSNAQVALRRSQVDVISQVRSGYFAVLVANETMHVSRTLAELADGVYQLQMKHVMSGEAAAYEPLQLFTQAMQARNYHLQARNRFFASWKQLAANLGTPDLPPHKLDGKVDAAVPRFESEQALRRIREHHTDVLTAQNSILQAQYQLRFAQVTPIPDVSTSVAIQHDNSTGNNQASVQVGFALPVFNRNQGNILAGRAHLTRALEDLRARQNDLTGRLAEATGRYQSSQMLVENYRVRIVPNLTRAYRAIYARHQEEPAKVGFNDIVVVQQNLSQALSAYLNAIGDQWTAVVDLANLLQIDDLYQPLVEEGR